MIPFLHTPPSSQILCHILINGIIIFTIPTPLILSSSHPFILSSSHPLILLPLILSASFTPALAYLLDDFSASPHPPWRMYSGKTFFCGWGPQKYEWGAPRFLQSSITILSHNISHVRRFEERILKKESRPERQLSLLSPSPWERDGVRLLLLHQELHDNFC